LTSYLRSIGDKAEQFVAQYLKKQGLNILQQNFQTRLGEIDLIAFDKKTNTIIFVEVKFRKQAHYGGAIAAVTTKKLNKMTKTANLWLQTNADYTDKPCRIDILCINGDLNFNNIDWIKGISAFDLPSFN